jgi:hypothetical protein
MEVGIFSQIAIRQNAPRRKIVRPTNSESVPETPKQESYSIDDFMPSPDGKYLAFLSSAEGVPFIQVVDLVEFVRKKTMKPVGELGPGPGASLKALRPV